MTLITEPQNPTFQINEILKFDYPRLNTIDNPNPSYSPRIIRITKIRDLTHKTLHPVTVQKNPLTTRGRWLITGICFDRNQERSFYFESMKHVARNTWLTLGLFDPIEPDPQPFFTIGIYAPIQRDRIFMAQIIQEFHAIESTINSLGVFPSEKAG